MKTIWKYEIAFTDEFTLDMPAGAKVLTVQAQAAHTYVWALVETTAPLEPRHFQVYGTGHPIFETEQLTYIGTVQIFGGTLVFHVFERGE